MQVPNTTDYSGAPFVVYDLRDDAARERAHADIRAWGRERTRIHTLDNDHIALEVLPGGALEIPA